MGLITLLGGLFISVAGIVLVCVKDQTSPGLYIAILGSLCLFIGTNLRIKNKIINTLDTGKRYRTAMINAKGPWVEEFLTKCSSGQKLTIRWQSHQLTPYRLAVYAKNTDGQEFILGYIDGRIGKYLFQYFAFNFYEHTEVEAEIDSVTGGKFKQCVISIKPLPNR